jgi:hypothetical protein
MAGAGIAPAGMTPFGVGTPATGAEPPSGPAGSRYINPVTRDYQVDPTTGQFAQMPPVRQRVLLAVLTARNSSAVPGFGTRLPPNMDESFESAVRAEITRALNQLTQVERVCRLDAVLVKRGRLGRAQITIVFVDLTTGTRDQLTV